MGWPWNVGSAPAATPVRPTGASLASAPQAAAPAPVLASDGVSLSGVQSPDTVDLIAKVKSARERNILSQLSPQAQAAYAALSEDQKSQFQTLFLAVSPQSQAALDKLLAGGQLTCYQDLREGKTLLTRLNDLAQPGAIAPELSADCLSSRPLECPVVPADDQFQRQPFLDQMVQETADPGLIHQATQGSCGATTVEYLLATRNPAEFVRVAAELASPAGKATLAGGQTVDIHDSRGLAFDHTKRSDVDRLMQSALMDAAAAVPGTHYDNTTDKGSFAPDMPGLNPSMMPQLLKQVLGDDREMVVPPPGPNHGKDIAGFLVTNIGGLAAGVGLALIAGPVGFLPVLASELGHGHAPNYDAIYDRIDQSLARGSGGVPVLTSFTTQDDAGKDVGALHYLLVVGVDRANHKVILRNPWGSWENGDTSNDHPTRSVVAGRDAGTIEMDMTQFERITQAVFPDQ